MAPDLDTDDHPEWEVAIDNNHEGLRTRGVHGPTTDLDDPKIPNLEDLERDWYNLTQPLFAEDKTLLNLLAFFDPDAVPHWLFLNNRAHIAKPELHFLTDDHEFGNAVTSLKRASLIVPSSPRQVIKLQRTVQNIVISHLAEAEKMEYMDYAIQILSSYFPNLWIERTDQQGFEWKSWKTSNAVLPHVDNLVELAKKGLFQIPNIELFADLIFRAGTYLWEQEKPTKARCLFEYGLSLTVEHCTASHAHAYRLLGHVALDLAQPESALTAYQKALEIKLELEDEDSPPIADVYDSIACSYTEMGKVKESFEYLAKAEAIHNAHNPLHMARTQAIYAMTYLRADQPAEALEALKKCWQLQNLTEEQIVDSDYPKHSGDLVLLARIKYAQGLQSEAQRLASQTVSIRRGIYGDHSPRVADSMFLSAQMLEAGDENMLAAKILRQVVDFSRGGSELHGHLVRSLWFLGILERRLGDVDSAERLQAEALNERNKLDGVGPLNENVDQCFKSLVSWMLW